MPVSSNVQNVKLQNPFVQLPVLFDAAALAAEVAAIAESEWIPHPQGFPGNSALPLIAVNGDVEAEGVEGPMRPTPLLARLPYMRQVLGRLGAVLGRTRLMRLSGNAEVTPHIDQGYYWAERMRVHVPVVTTPGVRFYCGDTNINMAAGECWIFDTWRLHRVHNDAEFSRIHLVIDTVGGDAFWELLARARPHHANPPGWSAQPVAPDARYDPALEFETLNVPQVMTPWELRSHIGFLFTECKPHANLQALQQSAMRFLRRWQALWTVHGEADDARARYESVRAEFVADVRRLGRDIFLRNDVSLASAMHAMVTQAALSGGVFAPPKAKRASPAAQREAGRDKEFDRPVFIVSPPRSGSTFLFETLAQAGNVFTIGDESHSLIEGIDALNPTLHGFVSNRLEAADATPSVSAQIRSRFRAALVDRDGGQPYGLPLRMLEKTPKNSLRVPFLAQIFPEAQFIYLHRDVREVLASMIEAWLSGSFITYRLPDWPEPPWSLLLVPGWRELAGKPLHEIVAAQWQATLRTLLDDLSALPRERVHIAHYAALRADTAAEIGRLCDAVDFVWDRPPAANPKLSRYTLTKPDADKWRKHEAEIEAVLPQLRDTIERAERFATR